LNLFGLTALATERWRECCPTFAAG